MLFQSGHRDFLRCAASAAGLLLLAACQPTIDQRGNLPEQDRMGQIAPGKTDKATVTWLLGSPSSVAAFDMNTWYYISQKTENLAFFRTELLDQQVVAITFDSDGVVKDIATRKFADRELVEPDPNATPSAGREFSLIEQFLGNFGKYVDKNRTNKGGSP